jgi:hypothetical protein
VAPSGADDFIGYQSTGSMMGTSATTTTITTAGSTLGGTGGAVGMSIPVGAYPDMAMKAEQKQPISKERNWKLSVSVRKSVKGHRVKVVGYEAVNDLAPIFIKWADRLGKDLRVVITKGMAPYEFYDIPMVAKRVGPNGLVLFLTGAGHDGSETQNLWRVGLDEIASNKAPSSLDSPEFPAYANIKDDKNVLIGRVEGKFIYTMLYIPTREVRLPDQKLPAGLAMKSAHKFEPDPRAIIPFIDHVFTRYEQVARSYRRELAGDLTDLSFREFCGDSQRKRHRLIKDSMDTLQREIRNLEESIMKKARDLREQQKEMALLNSGALDTELMREVQKLDKLVDDGLYEKFKVRHRRIVGLSAPVTIEHEKKKYHLGKFLVSIRQDGAIEIRHESRPHPFHPHINKESERPCLGNIGSDVPKLVGMERYAMVFQIMHEWLHCYNIGSRHNAIEACIPGAKPAPNIAVMDEGPQVVVPGPARPVAAIREIQRDIENAVARTFTVDPALLASERNR